VNSTWPGAQALALDRLRFLDLDDHVGLGEDLLGRVDDLAPAAT
jgi:hypothetical protein